MTTAIPESVRLCLKQNLIANYIDGEWRPARSGKSHQVMNPSDGSTLAKTALSDAADIDAAVGAAARAFGAWSSKPPVERAVVLHRLADAMEKHTADIAAIESLDVGKAVSAAEAFDAPFGIACLRYFADLSTHAQYERPLAIRNMEARVHRRAYGVCGFIIPWNFPFDLLMWGIAPALAAGNTVVVKPSEVTPLSTLYICQLAEEVGFPKGVMNCVVGTGPDAGMPLVEHPCVRRMSFTGSPSVGKLIAEACGRRLIPCKLELGGKGAAVVLDDADPVSTGKQLAAAITLNTGQVCCTATRWIVHEKVRAPLVQAATEALKSTRIGPGVDRSTDMGPLASAAHRDRVLNHLNRGIAQGARYLLDGGAFTVKGFENGYYVSPTLLEGDPDNTCCREEIFGPSAYVLSFNDDAEAVALVNRLSYGLANSVWSPNLPRANHVAEQLVAGNGWINAHNVFAYGLPYGGVNLSGIGDGVNSPETFYDYLRPQTIARPL